jgi:hypothetical protein
LASKGSALKIAARLWGSIPARLHLPVIGLGLWLFVALLLVYTCRAVILGRSGWDPDDQLRLVQLRDFLGGQSWFDTTQYRLNPPYGAAMHWSRLIELPLALVVTLASPVIGAARAEMLAGTAVPLACLGAIAFMASAIATRIGGRLAGGIAIVLVLMAPAVLMQTRPMRIDHHGWQAVMAMLGLWSLFWASRKWGGVALGIALATWLHISLEGAPVSAAFFLLLGWRWIVERGEGVRLFWTISAFALASFALFFGTQSAGLSAINHCDTISPMHVIAIGLGALILLPVIHLRPAQLHWRLSATLVALVAIVTTVLLASPVCGQGTFATLDPLVRAYWYVNVNEGLPLWRQDIEAAATLIAGPIVGLAALWAIWHKHKSPELNALAFLTVYAVLLSLFVFRTVSVAAAFAAVPVAIWLVQLIQNWRTCEVPLRRMALVLLILLLIIPGAVAGPFVRKLAAEPAAAPASNSSASSEKCEAVKSVRMLSMLPDSDIIAPFDMGPAILMTTRHRVLASSHHRNKAGMHDQIAIFRSPPETARKLLAKHGINRIAACASEAEMEYYAEKDPAGLWAQLARAKPPEWLEYEGIYGDGITVWRIKGAENP